MSHINFLDKHLSGVLEWQPLGDLCKIFNGYAFQSKLFNTLGAGLPLIRIRDVNTGFSETYYSGNYDDRYLVDNGDILIGMDGDFRAVRWEYGEALLNQRVCRLQEFVPEIMPSFIFYLMQDTLDQIQSKIQGSTVKHLSSKELGQVLIPVPSLTVQAKIVRILDTFTKLTAELTAELTARKKQYNYYRDQLLSFEEGEVEWKKLGTIVSISTGSKPPEIFENATSFDYINAGTARSGYSATSNCEGDTVTTPSRGQGGIGYVGYQGKPFWLGPLCYKLQTIDRSVLINKYLFYFLQSKRNLLLSLKKEGGVPAVNKSDLAKLEIPIPTLKAQQKIVATLDNFDALINSITEGLPREIELRQKQYEYYRDLLLSFPKPEAVKA